MEQKIGRPNSYQTDEIKLIIDQYVRYSEGKSLISASKVAKFATEELDFDDNFKYYVIQRNPEAKRYLEEINERIKNCTISKGGTLVAIFKTLDIEAMMNMTPKQLRAGLLNLNTLIEDTSDKHTKVIQENMGLSRQIASLKMEAVGYKKEVDELIEKVKSREDELTAVIKKQKAEIEALESIFHMVWDKETETLLKKQKIFLDDGTEINKNKTITDPTFNLTKIVNIIEIKKNESKSTATEMRHEYLQVLEDI